MSNVDRKIEQLCRLLQTAHYENYDFVYLPVGDAVTVVELLEEYKRKEDKRGGETDCKVQVPVV